MDANDLWSTKVMTLEEQRDFLVKVLESLADRGCHADLNPTRRVYHQNPEWEAADSWWVSYLGRCDQSVRTRASEALKHVGAR